jgi:hypothetical protein
LTIRREDIFALKQNMIATAQAPFVCLFEHIEQFSQLCLTIVWAAKENPTELSRAKEGLTTNRTYLNS